MFILSGAEDLVPVSVTQQTIGGIGWEQTTYRPRTEGLFARIIRHKKTNGEHYWEAVSYTHLEIKLSMTVKGFDLIHSYRSN